MDMKPPPIQVRHPALSAASSVYDSDNITLTSQDEPNPPPAEWKAGKREWLVILTLTFLSLMVAIDATILVTALPTISIDLNGSANAAFWIGTSYLLSSSVVMPFMGALSDVLGRREILMVSVLFFAAGSVLAAVAKSMTVLLAGRCLQGIGGGGLMPLAQVVMCDIVPLRQRPKYAAVIQFAWAVGTIAGPLLGGLLVDHANWRWIFYLNFPFCIIGAIIVPFVVRLKNKPTSMVDKVFRIDWIGGLLFIGSMTSFLVGITWGGVNYAWDNVGTVLPIVLGALGVIIVWAWEKWIAPEPFIRLAVFSNISAKVGYVGAMIQGLLLYIQVYYIPYFFVSAKGYSPTKTGVAVLPISSVFVPVGIIVSVLISKLGRIRWALWSGWVFQITGCGLLILLDDSLATWKWVLIFMVAGLGHGLLVQALTYVPQAMAANSDAAYAATMYTFVRTFGMTFGVAIGGTVFQNMMKHHLRDLGLDEIVADMAEQFTLMIKGIPEPGKSKYISAYEKSFQNVFEVALAISILGGLLSLLTQKAQFDKELETEHGLEEHEMKKTKRSRADAV